jgi:light-regulated signal transduction histidine kinase (bacteriophytochrome)
MPQLSTAVQSYLHRIQDNAQNMGRMIDDLLALMSISRQPVNLQTISPARLVEQALDELRSAQEGRRISITIGDLPVCRADPVMLRRVFVNLLANALKFTRRRAIAHIEIGSRQGVMPNEPMYFVKDNGVGFDMQYANKLFGVFEHLHSLQGYEGTGVGLAIVQRIIQRHGGRVWAEAAVDQGATFRFTLGEGHDQRLTTA